MDNNVSVLIDLGLSESEAGAYLALLKLGGAKPSEVAKEMGIQRTTVYAILKELTQKGFATLYFRGVHRYYHAQKPKRLTSIFEKKLENFQEILPQLNAAERKQGGAVGLRYLETKEELKLFYSEILDEYQNGEYSIIGSAKSWEGIDPDYFVQYRKDRGQAKIKTRLLLSAESEEVNPTDDKLLRSFRYLPEKYQFRSTIDIYDDKILVVGPDVSAAAVVIEVPAMVDVFKSVFEALWDANEIKAS